MDVARAVDRYFDAVSHARAALSPGVFAPFASFAALQAVILFAMASFTAPLIAPFMVPAMRLLGGEPSLHYPMHLVGLPSVYQRLYIPLAAGVGFTLWTLAVWKLVDRHPVGSERPSRAFRPFALRTVLIGALFVAASVLPGEAATRLTGPRTPDLIVRALVFASVAVTALLQSLCVYAPVALRLRGRSAWDAVRASVAYARRHFPATVLLVLTVLIVHLPVDFLLSRADRIAARFHPEAVLYILLGSAALEALTAYLLLAGVTEMALPREGSLK
jgi:hypothetical protein